MKATTPPASGTRAPAADPLRALLEEMVVPGLEQALAAANIRHAPVSFPTADPAEGPDGEAEDAPPGGPTARVCTDAGYAIDVSAAAIDGQRTLLRMRMLIGVFLDNPTLAALIVGNLIDDTPFHVRMDMQLGFTGQMAIGCDLVVRKDDGPLACQRLSELVNLSVDLDWFFPLRLPTRLSVGAVHVLDVPWDELPHDDLGAFLDAGLQCPPGERTPLALCCIAHGLGRWKDLLQLLREHPEALPRKQAAPLKMLALCQLGRWLPALRAAREGGIRNGRFAGARNLSPSHLRALVEAGDEIEALRLLGGPAAGEPAFYDWLRGLALHDAGDREGARQAFARYFGRWPGDVVGLHATRGRVCDDD